MLLVSFGCFSFFFFSSSQLGMPQNGSHRSIRRSLSSPRSHHQQRDTAVRRPWSEELMDGVIHEFHSFTPELSQQMRRPLPPRASLKNRSYLRTASSLFTHPLLPPLVHRDEFQDIDRCLTGLDEMHFGEQLAFAALLVEVDRDMAFLAALAVAMLRKPKIRRWEQTAVAQGAVDIWRRPSLGYPTRRLSHHLPNAHFARVGITEVPTKKLSVLIGNRLSEFLAFCFGHCVLLPTKEVIASICRDLHHDHAEHPESIVSRVASQLWTHAALGGNLGGASLLSSLLPPPRNSAAAGGLPKRQLPPIRNEDAVKFYAHAMAEDEIEFAEQVAEYGYSAEMCFRAKRDPHGRRSSPKTLLHYAAGFGHLDLLRRMERVMGSHWHVDHSCAELVQSSIGLMPDHAGMLEWYKGAVGRCTPDLPILESAAIFCNADLFDALNVAIPHSSWKKCLARASSISMLCHMLTRAPLEVGIDTVANDWTGRLHAKHLLKPGQLKLVMDRRRSDLSFLPKLRADYVRVRWEYSTVEDLEVLLAVTTESMGMVSNVLFGACSRSDISVLNFALETWPEIVQSAAPWLAQHLGDGGLCSTQLKPEAWLTEDEYVAVAKLKEDNTVGTLLNSLQVAAARGHCGVLRWIRENAAPASLFRQPPKDNPANMHSSAIELLVAYACSMGDIAALDFADECGFHGWNHRVDTVFGFTPAHIAAAHNQEQVLKRLVEQHHVPLFGAGAVLDFKSHNAGFYLDADFMSSTFLQTARANVRSIPKPKSVSKQLSGRRQRLLGPTVLTFSDVDDDAGSTSEASSSSEI